MSLRTCKSCYAVFKIFNLSPISNTFPPTVLAWHTILPPHSVNQSVIHTFGTSSSMQRGLDCEWCRGGGVGEWSGLTTTAAFIIQTNIHIHVVFLFDFHLLSCEFRRTLDNILIVALLFGQVKRWPIDQLEVFSFVPALDLD